MYGNLFLNLLIVKHCFSQEHSGVLHFAYIFFPTIFATKYNNKKIKLHTINALKERKKIVLKNGALVIFDKTFPINAKLPENVKTIAANIPRTVTKST